MYQEQNIVNLTGQGIDVRKLLNGQEAEFEIANEEFCDEYKNPYFDNEEVLKNLNFECTFEGEDSDSDEKTPFERMAIGMEDVTQVRDRGVLKKVIKDGTGNIIPDGSLVRVHYNGYLEFSEEPFDSSRLRGKQMQITLGKGEMLPGWETALKSMKKGEISRFLVSSKYAYGKMGCPPRIPGDSTVMLEIEVINVVNRGAADEFENFTEKQKEKTQFDHIIKVADSLREVGNEAFNNRQMSQALKSYRKAINYLESCRLANEEEERTMLSMCLKLYLNSSLCCLKINEFGKAAMYARKALQIDRRQVKAHFRLGRALLQMGEFDDAKGSLLQAQRLSPGNKEIFDELQKLEENIKKFNALNKSMCGKMFHSDGKSAECTNRDLDVDNKVSKSVVEYAMKKLREFKLNPNKTECSVPFCLKSDEIAEICNLAADLGLSVVEDKEGNLAVVKKILEEQQV